MGVHSISTVKDVLFAQEITPVVSNIDGVRVYEVYNNRDNLAQLNNLFESYNVPIDERGVPIVFVAQEYCIGKNIPQDLPELLSRQDAVDCPTADRTENSISLIAIIGAAFVDSINPCAIAVLLILLGGLLAAKSKRRILLGGISFIVAIYISYLLFGLGIISVLHITNLAFWFSQAVGYLAILIGILNIKDYFWYGGGGFMMEIPRSWRPYLKKFLGAITTPLGAFVAGFAITLFELPCTGGPYLFVLGLIAKQPVQALPLLLLYNLVFIIPLLVILGLVYFGRTSIEQATEWKDRNIRLFHLIGGSIMIVLGLVVLLL